MLKVTGRSVHPQCLSVQSRWQVNEASSTGGGWIIRLKMLGHDSSVGQQQVNITSTPPGHHQRLHCAPHGQRPSLHFSAFSFLQSKRTGGGTTQALCPAGMHQSWAREVERTCGGGSRQRRGWKLCQGGECPGWHRDMKPRCMVCLLALAMNPLLDPSHISHYEIRPRRAESASQWSGTI